MSDQPGPWEPDPRKMGNWTSMFDNGRTPRAAENAASSVPASVPLEAASEPEGDETEIEPGLTPYRPWVLQRGRSRPVMMLHLRRFDRKAGFWMGWQISYPHLVAAEYVGHRMLSLDFGTRQFVIEGNGLDELARHLQTGSVLLLQEFSKEVWAGAPSDGLTIDSIKKL